MSMSRGRQKKPLAGGAAVGGARWHCSNPADCVPLPLRGRISEATEGGMVVLLQRWLGRRATRYVRRPPLVLINGLAEQAETWFRNVEAWRCRFTVHAPELLAYEGEALH